MKKTILATCLVALLAAAPAMAQVDFTNYVALGDSNTAGFVSGSLMDWYQNRSYPAVLADQAGSPTFEQAYVSEPGFGPIFELRSLAPIPDIGPVGLIPGAPTNVEYPYPYNNLGVPGANLFDMLFQTGDISNLIQGNTDNAMFDLVLRNGINSALELAVISQPTFLTMWIGNNDVLTAALAATPIEGITMTPVQIFRDLYTNAAGFLATNTTADVVLINLPYPTTIPFVTTVEPFVDIPGFGRWYLMADTGPLTDDDLVTLLAGDFIAEGYGLPEGPPLPDNLSIFTGEPGVVLRPAEVDLINAQIDAFNEIIAEVGATFGFPVFDANALFSAISSGEQAFTYGGYTLSTDFLTGGIFSYDGVHPQRIGYALVADELIQFLNAEYGMTIPRVNMAQVIFEGDWQSPAVLPAQAKNVVFSREAFEVLYQLAPPNLEDIPRIRRPNPDPGDTLRRDPRIKPTTIK